MYRQAIATMVKILIPMAFWHAGSAFAVAHPYEFHADARMQHEHIGPVEKAYGYTYIVTDADGKGSINVMFSNGSELKGLSFNARVKFLDAAGSIIEEEYFESWIDAAGYREPVESKETKPLPISDFESIEVEFYLTEIPQIDQTEIVDIGYPVGHAKDTLVSGF